MPETALRELADDIREHGLNDSIVVAVHDPGIEAIFNNYEVIEGDDGSISEVPDGAEAEIEAGTHRVLIDGSNWPSAMVT